MIKFSLVLLLLCLCATFAAAAGQPNIVWIFVEDQSDHYGPYGETLAKTPNVDKLAAEGAKFTRAFVTAPVCSPARSALVTGMYQTTIGAHNHRSGRGAIKIDLPGEVRLMPAMMREAGYYVTNGRFGDDESLARGKTDYNFEYPSQLYDGSDWSGRAADQPFFAQVHLCGGKNRDQRTLKHRDSVHTNGIDPKKVKLPPYYPDHPELRQDWALYLESIEHVDWEVGRIMARLDREGVADNTIVFFLTDHGISHARGKQFLTEEGIKVPLIVRAPGRIEPGLVREDLVAHIDVTASSLYFAGIEIPGWMEGRTLFGPDAKPREYVVSARDRCDETVEHMRSVRTKRYKYIRNYLHQRPHLQPNRYKDGKAIIKRMHALHEGGELKPEIDRLFFAPRPYEELYDLDKDPWEMNNLASEDQAKDKLRELAGILDRWIDETGDKGRELEPESVYDADMDVYSSGQKGIQGEVLRKNIAQMKAWAAEGK